MAAVQRFEDIEAWKRAREECREVYRITLEGGFRRDFKLIDQIRAAAVSVMSNIAEGFERDGNGEFRQFLCIAKGSVGEVRSQLYVALDAGYIDQTTHAQLSRQAVDVGRLLGGFIRYLDQTALNGRKHPV